MNNNQLGTVGLLVAQQWFVEQGYSVFTEIDGKAPFDFVIYSNGKLLRVEVKSTERLKGNSYTVNLRSTRWNRTSLVSKVFDSTKSDLCCVYVAPIKKLFIRPSSVLEGRTSWNINPKDLPIEVVLGE